MNLLLRLLLTILRSVRRPRIHPLASSSVPFRVLPNDLDINLHMNNGRYLAVMDLARLDLMARFGLLGEVRRRRWMPVVGALTIRYRRPLDPFDGYRVDTRMLCWDEKWFYLEQRFVRQGSVVSIAFVKGLFQSAGGPVPPADIVRAAGFEIASPPMPEAVSLWQRSEAAMLETPAHAEVKA